MSPKPIPMDRVEMRPTLLAELLKMPTVVNNLHESLFRSYHTLDLVCYLLAQEVPHKVILELIENIKNLPNVEDIWPLLTSP